MSGKAYPVGMTSGQSNHWTSGNAMPWLLGVTLGVILGIALLIIIPRALGNTQAAAPAAEGATAATTGAATTPTPAAPAASNATGGEATAPAATEPAATEPAATEPAATTPAATAPATEPAAGEATASAEGDAGAGKEKFTSNCAGCHGMNAEGGVGPALAVTKGWTNEQFALAVREGKAPEKTLGGMMPHFTAAQLSDADVNNIHAYVKSLN